MTIQIEIDQTAAYDETFVEETLREISSAMGWEIRSVDLYELEQP